MKLTTPSNVNPRILVLGCCGQIGTELVPLLKKKYGVSNVISSDIKKPINYANFQDGGGFHYVDVTNPDHINNLVVEKNINSIIHLSSILSAAGEKNVQLAMQVNLLGLHNVLESARKYELKVFAPSTIAAFGPTTPRNNTPDTTVMRPTTIYGITKVYLELLGEYYFNKFGVDFRSLRYPGVISSEAPPGGGTTDYAVEIFHEAIKNKSYTSFLKNDTVLPMMHMHDCLKSTIQLLEAPNEKLTQRTYNVTAVSFSPEELANEIKKHIPEFKISYKPDFRQKIADSWPRSLDDSIARSDWSWNPEYDLKKMTSEMLKNIKRQYTTK